MYMLQVIIQYYFTLCRITHVQTHTYTHIDLGRKTDISYLGKKELSIAFRNYTCFSDIYTEGMYIIFFFGRQSIEKACISSGYLIINDKKYMIHHWYWSILKYCPVNLIDTASIYCWYVHITFCDTAYFVHVYMYVHTFWHF